MMGMFGFPIIDPSSDEGQYRINCYRYILANPTKFPETTSFLEIERKIGNILFTLGMLGQAMSESFQRNEPIAECARQLEELHRIGRLQAEKIYEDHLKATEKGNIH